jgi:translation initiation factor 1
MTKQKNTVSRLVYSTDGGRLCPQCLRTVVNCVCGNSKPAATGDGIVRLHRETKGRGGKAVTLIKGLPLSGDALKALTSQLKKRCGVGGSLKDDIIEIQGDHRTFLKGELEKLGYPVKISGS